jgi:VWFA-related protein
VFPLLSAAAPKGKQRGQATGARKERVKRSRQVRVDRCAAGLRLIFGLTLFAASVRSQTPPASPAISQPDSVPAAPQEPSPAPANPGSGAASGTEVSSRDTAPTFKVRVNLVLVRVVVRDSQGDVVPNLKKEDFQLFDNRKPQTISSFSVETPATHAIVPTAAATPSIQAAVEAPALTPTALPQRFVSVVFDDTSLSTTDAVTVRSAATRLFASLVPSDRVGIYTTSGQFAQEFTADREALQESLLRIVPHPLSTSPGMHPCPEVNYYQADQIVNFHNAQALDVATEDAVQCAFNGDESQRAQAASIAASSAQQAANLGDAQSDYIYRHLEDAMRRLSAMPGQRVMVFVSPGFIVTMYTREGGDLIDRANRANIVINTIDARGLYTPDMGDLADPPRDSLLTAGPKTMYRTSAQFAQTEILAQLADGTGGTFFHNRNDLDEGLRRAVAAPSLSYLLAFSPQNLRVDGRYHTLKVSLTGKQKYTVQTRHGYYAPRTVKDPAEAAKQEIQEAIFSQEEIHDVPIDLQTQFFKMDETQAKLAVLTHVDMKGIHFRKAEGRSLDDLTFATAIFDQNGNFVTGGEKIVQMRLLDPTLNRLSRSGFTVKSSFDVKPGTYLVRLVVRDAEGSQMAARNGAVVIPY